MECLNVSEIRKREIRFLKRRLTNSEFNHKWGSSNSFGATGPEKLNLMRCKRQESHLVVKIVVNATVLAL